jgi:DNA mismatch endonuclease (patch repair protein)
MTHGSSPGGRRPPASSQAAAKRLIAQGTRDTTPELALRHELHNAGLRYRLHVQLLPGLRREVDIAFPKARVAVFVDGCFWHGCPEHPRPSRTHSDWWARKIGENRARDEDTDRRLALAGWTVLRVWEHDDVEQAADRVRVLVTARRARPEPLHRLADRDQSVISRRRSAHPENRNAPSHT